MKEQRAAHIPMRVVSAKRPGHWIVRGIRCFATKEQVREEVLNFTGRLDDELEWTTFEYILPSYIVYERGDILALGTWPSGVYRMDHLGNDVYGEPRLLGAGAASMHEQWQRVAN